MKLFSKLLTLSITALVCQTSMAGFKKSISPNQVTPEMLKVIESIKKNNELQEDLAQGLIDGDHNAIEQALAAGANPFICHKTNVARNEVLNLLSEDAKAEILAAEEISPYYGLFYVHQAALNNEAILKLTETLLKNGVSVDREPTASNGGFGYTFRQFIDLGLEDCESILENNVPALTEVQRQVMTIRAKLLKDLLTLMQKYQPVEMEYASSFRFFNQPEAKA